MRRVMRRCAGRVMRRCATAGGAGAEGQRAAMVAGAKGTARARGQGGYRRYEQNKMGPVNHGLLTGPTAYRPGKRFVHPTGLLREGSDDATRRATHPL